jgi:hypothetical protein
MSIRKIAICSSGVVPTKEVIGFASNDADNGRELVNQMGTMAKEE